MEYYLFYMSNIHLKIEKKKLHNLSMSYNLLRFKTYKRETSYIKKKRKYRSRSKSSNRREKIIKEHYSYLSKGFFFFFFLMHPIFLM